MLQWICPECGRECEPAERDCPVCYPQAEAKPAPPPMAPKAAKLKAPEPVAKPAAAPVLSVAPPVSVPPPLPPRVLPQEFSSPAVAKAAPVPPPIPVAVAVAVQEKETEVAATLEPAFEPQEGAASIPPPIPAFTQHESAPVASLPETALGQPKPVAELTVEQPESVASVPPPIPAFAQQEPAPIASLPVTAFEQPEPVAAPLPIPAVQQKVADVLSALELTVEQPESVASVPPPIPAFAQQEPAPIASLPVTAFEQPGPVSAPVPIPAVQQKVADVLAALDITIEQSESVATVPPTFTQQESAPVASLPETAFEQPEPVAAPLPIAAAVQHKVADVLSALDLTVDQPEFVAAVPPPVEALVQQESAPVASLPETAFEQPEPVASPLPILAAAQHKVADVASALELAVEQSEPAEPVPPPIPALAKEELAPVASASESMAPPPIPTTATSAVEPEGEPAPATPQDLLTSPAANRRRFAPPAAPAFPQPPPQSHAMSPLRMPLAVPPSLPAMHSPVALDPASVRGSYPIPPPQPEPSFPRDAMSLEALLEARPAEPSPAAASAAALELESGSTLVAVLDPPESIEPPELPTAKFPVPNLQPPAVAGVQPKPQPDPDPVPAGLTALSATMKAFDDRTGRVDVAAAAVLDPIPAPAGEILLDLANHETPTLLRTGSFELHEGQLRPLTLPDVATPPQASHTALEADSQWLPLPEQAKPQPPRGTRELEFDPALLHYMEVQEEQEAELRAMDAVGLAPLSPLVFEAASKPPSGPGLHTGSVQYAACQTEEIVVIRSDGKPWVDEDLRQRVVEYEAEQQAIRELTAAASKSAPMLVFADAVSRIGIRRPGTPASPQTAFRGFTPWPQMGPVGRPVSAFEMEFDAAVLNRVQEWEESRLSQELEAQQLAAEEPPTVESVVEQEEFVAEFATTAPVEPPAELVAEPVLEQSLVAYGTVEEEAQEEEVVVHALTPIVEVTVPPIAKMTKLPGLQLQAVGVKPRLRQAAPQAEFSEFSPLVPTIGKLVKIIPSPIMNIQHSKVMAPPGWLVTAAIALLIPITALGVVNYWILPSQRGVAAAAPAATASVATPAPTASATTPAAKTAAPPAVPAASPWQKQLEFTGLRLQNSTVKCLVVNHGKDTPVLHLLVTLRSSRGVNDPPVGTFKVRLSPLGAGSSREIAEPISFTPPMRSIDWSDLRSDVELLKP